MRRAKKKFLGLLGLSLVAVMTTVAISMPTPEAAAITTVTDTIEVRVIGGTPAVDLRSSVEGKNVSSPHFTLNMDYENVARAKIYLRYVDDGSEPVEIAVYNDLESPAGSIYAGFMLDKYGEYIVTAEAFGYDGTPAPEDYIRFKYVPVVASVSLNQVSGKYEITLESYGSDVNEVSYYLGNEEIATLTKDNFNQIVSFSMAGRPSGTYTINVVAKSDTGAMIYSPLALTIDYEAAEVPNAGTPDTGGLFKNLNISREDYLVTGLILFFVLGVVAFGIVARGHKKSSKKRH